MAMQPTGRRDSVVSDINVTPMADIMIVLLIIFMVATPLISQSSVALPMAAHTKERPPDVVKLTLLPTGLVAVNDVALRHLDELDGHLRARRASAGAGASVVIEADRQVDYAQVAHVLAACRRAGVEEIGLAAQPRVSD
jgi:biopolymer transport protein TolR